MARKKRTVHKGPLPSYEVPSSSLRGPGAAGSTRRDFLGRGVGWTVGGVLGAGALSAGGCAPGGENASVTTPDSLWPIGLDDLETPALVLDVAAMDRNLDRMARFAAEREIGLRPHAKTHKCVEIARRQLERGALGVCVAKLGEAEALADGGIEKIHVTSPVATPKKFERALALAAKLRDFQLLVDHRDVATELDRRAGERGIKLRVIVGLDTGTLRTGSPLGQPAVDLALHVDSLANLAFDGLQVYAGHVMHVKGHAERKRRSVETLAACVETRKQIEAAGIPVGVFTGGGTGTYDIDCDVDAMTDLQVGSYAFMDTQYRAIGGADGDVFDDFEPSLFVLTTAISQPSPRAITVDAGSKSMAYEPNSPPEFFGRSGLRYHYGGDEHGIVELLDTPGGLAHGEKALLLVSHCDPTVNLYDRYHLLERDEDDQTGQITGTWNVAARGRAT